MKSTIKSVIPPMRRLRTVLLLGVAMPMAGAFATPAPTWQVVVNNASLAPQSTTAYFSSYNQPAVNRAGKVVFRARAKPLSGAGSSKPTHGVYTRNMSVPGAPIEVIADNLGMLVPAPNTTGATFIDFPSTPRSDATSAMIATRAQSTGVVTLPDGTKVGTSGVYATPRLVLATGAAQLGDVAGYEYFQVPGALPGIAFDQFPGSPSPLNNSVVTFKGNYTEDTIGKTGIFYRNMLTGGGTSPVKLVAHTGTPIPEGGGAIFGSTAPPSAAVDRSTGALNVVFAGFDNEDAPTAGGIYIARLGAQKSLRPVVSIGSAVPGVDGAVFAGFGEALSFTGRFASFWGSWGTQMMIVHKDCPTDGNVDLIAYCKSQYPNGVDLSERVNQGIFFADTLTNDIYLLARTGVDGFTDFLYWTYSGKPPGSSGGGDAELPRWRSATFSAATALDVQAVAFKGQKGPVDGLYLHVNSTDTLRTVLDTTMDGQSVDPAAPAGSTVSSIGLERDGFRQGWIAISAGMENVATAETWAGIYIRNCGASCSKW